MTSSESSSSIGVDVVFASRFDRRVFTTSLFNVSAVVNASVGRLRIALDPAACRPVRFLGLAVFS